MIWPQATDYNAAVQNPQVCFRDDDLRHGQAPSDLFGLPCPHSGNFADVYQIQDGDGQSWAVKCFTRPVHGLRQRYQAISDHLRHSQRAFMVEFRYLEEGIRVRGQCYPIVKMRWVEGQRLNDFLRDHLDKPALLDRLAEMWVRLAHELREAGLGHGDLQHGNVLLVPGSKSASLALKLIDYDGMFVPALADTPSGEVGHPNYQHPERLRQGAYHGEIDRFSHLLIYTALRCLGVAGADLWQRYDNQENLLFRDSDFQRPRESALLRELWRLKDRDARDLVGHLLLASQRPLEATPLLEELLDQKVVRPLRGREEEQINALLEDISSPRGARTILRPASVGEGARAPVTVLETAPVAETVPLRAQATPPPPLRLPPSETQPRVGTVLQTRRDRGGRMDPVVSMLSRPAFLTVLAAIALTSFLLINVLVWSFARQPSPPPPSPKQPHLLVIEDVTLRGGEKRDIALRVERNDSNKALTLHIDGLPAEMRVHVLTVAADRESVSLPLSAPYDFEQPPGVVYVSLWEDDRRLDEKQFHLSIHKVSRPALPRTAEAPPRARPKAEKKVETPLPPPLVTKRPTPTPPPLTKRSNLPRENVTFETVDHLRLAGTLYPGSKDKSGACILMLHDLNSDRSAPAWQRLAEALQIEGHTVLTFDFRGCGQSKNVKREFWTMPINQHLPAFQRSNPLPTKIDCRDFPAAYFPWLIHDIAAARMWLDGRHDEPESTVNTYNILVIGAGTGAALGSLWLASEGIRCDVKADDKKAKPEWLKNRDIIAAAWLGIEPSFKGRKFPVADWVRWAHRVQVDPTTLVPLAFLYGEDDAQGRDTTARLIANGNGEAKPIPGASQSGLPLLETNPAAEKIVRQQIARLLKAHHYRAWERETRHLKTYRWFWGFPTPRGEHDFYLAKNPEEGICRPVPLNGFDNISIAGMSDPPVVKLGKE